MRKKHKMCWQAKFAIWIFGIALIIGYILFHDIGWCDDFQYYDMPVVIFSPDDADILLLENTDFEINNFIAQGFYRMYDTADYVIDTGAIFLILPEYSYDCNRDGKVNLFDITHWLNVVYFGY